MDLLQRGELKQAAAEFEAGLRLAPRAPALMHFLGLTYHQLGRDDLGVPLLESALKDSPGERAYGLNLGRVLAELGKLEEALALLERLQQPEGPDLLDLMGMVRLRMGRIEEAIGDFYRALKLQPGFVPAWNNLGGAYARLGRWAEAIQALEQALKLAPKSIEILNNLAQALLFAGAIEQAVARLRFALSLEPGNARSTLNLAKALEEQEKEPEALVCCEEALKRHPQDVRLLMEVGNLRRGLGAYESSLQCFQKAAELAPAYFPARWQAQLTLPTIYSSESQMRVLRERWLQGVRSLENGVEQGAFDPGSLGVPQTNFYLHYQGLNDREAQGLYGRLVTRVATKLLPEVAIPARKPFRGGRKIRVGFVSAFFNLHTIFKLFGGWITQLNRQEFETYVYHFGSGRDRATDFLGQHAAQLVSGQLPLGAAAEAIARAELDVLIYPDIGMDALTQTLAALRLAPVQCQAWGHPITSGLESIDYFLSSELMEPPQAQEHYHEKLVRLPQLSIWYAEPDTGVAAAPPGLPQGGRGVRLVCLQSLFKLLPSQDRLFARVAAQLPDAQFWFIQHRSAAVTQQYRSRLEMAFAELGAASLGQVHFLPPLKYGEFLGLIREADVILDSMGWSGGNTSLEALAFSKPVVTLPGQMMRSRHTAGILRRIGVDQTIARDEADYVNLVAGLAQNRGWREEIFAKMRQGKPLAYRDEEPVRYLEGFLQQAVATV